MPEQSAEELAATMQQAQQQQRSAATQSIAPDPNSPEAITAEESEYERFAREMQEKYKTQSSELERRKRDDYWAGTYRDMTITAPADPFTFGQAPIGSMSGEASGEMQARRQMFAEWYQRAAVQYEQNADEILRRQLARNAVAEMQIQDARIDAQHIIEQTVATQSPADAAKSLTDAGQYKPGMSWLENIQREDYAVAGAEYTKAVHEAQTQQDLAVARGYEAGDFTQQVQKQTIEEARKERELAGIYKGSGVSPYQSNVQLPTQESPSSFGKTTGGGKVFLDTGWQTFESTYPAGGRLAEAPYKRGVFGGDAGSIDYLAGSMNQEAIAWRAARMKEPAAKPSDSGYEELYWFFARGPTERGSSVGYGLADDLAQRTPEARRAYLESLNEPGAPLYEPSREKEPGAEYSPYEFAFGRTPRPKEGAYSPVVTNPSYTLYKTEQGAWMKIGPTGQIEEGGSAGSWDVMLSRREFRPRGEYSSDLPWGQQYGTGWVLGPNPFPGHEGEVLATPPDSYGTRVFGGGRKSVEFLATSMEPEAVAWREARKLEGPAHKGDAGYRNIAFGSQYDVVVGLAKMSGINRSRVFAGMSTPGAELYEPSKAKEPGAKFSANDLFFGPTDETGQRKPWSKEGEYAPLVLNKDFTIWATKEGAWAKVGKTGQVEASGGAGSWEEEFNQQVLARPLARPLPHETFWSSGEAPSRITEYSDDFGLIKTEVEYPSGWKETIPGPKSKERDEQAAKDTAENYRDEMMAGPWWKRRELIIHDFGAAWESLKSGGRWGKAMSEATPGDTAFGLFKSGLKADVPDFSEAKNTLVEVAERDLQDYTGVITPYKEPTNYGQRVVNELATRPLHYATMGAELYTLGGAMELLLAPKAAFGIGIAVMGTSTAYSGYQILKAPPEKRGDMLVTAGAEAAVMLALMGPSTYRSAVRAYGSPRTWPGKVESFARWQASDIAAEARQPTPVGDWIRGRPGDVGAPGYSDIATRRAMSQRLYQGEPLPPMERPIQIQSMQRAYAEGKMPELEFRMQQRLINDIMRRERGIVKPEAVVEMGAAFEPRTGRALPIEVHEQHPGSIDFNVLKRVKDVLESHGITWAEIHTHAKSAISMPSHQDGLEFIRNKNLQFADSIGGKSIVRMTRAKPAQSEVVLNAIAQRMEANMKSAPQRGLTLAQANLEYMQGLQEMGIDMTVFYNARYYKQPPGLGTLFGEPALRGVVKRTPAGLKRVGYLEPDVSGGVADTGESWFSRWGRKAVRAARGEGAYPKASKPFVPIRESGPTDVWIDSKAGTATVFTPDRRITTLSGTARTVAGGVSRGSIEFTEAGTTRLTNVDVTQIDATGRSLKDLQFLDRVVRTQQADMYYRGAPIWEGQYPGARVRGILSMRLETRAPPDTLFRGTRNLPRPLLAGPEPTLALPGGNTPLLLPEPRPAGLSARDEALLRWETSWQQSPADRYNVIHLGGKFQDTLPAPPTREMLPLPRRYRVGGRMPSPSGPPIRMETTLEDYTGLWVTGAPPVALEPSWLRIKATAAMQGAPQPVPLLAAPGETPLLPAPPKRAFIAEFAESTLAAETRSTRFPTQEELFPEEMPSREVFGIGKVSRKWVQPAKQESPKSTPLSIAPRATSSTSRSGLVLEMKPPSSRAPPVVIDTVEKPSRVKPAEKTANVPQDIDELLPIQKRSTLPPQVRGTSWLSRETVYPFATFDASLGMVTRRGKMLAPIALERPMPVQKGGIATGQLPRVDAGIDVGITTIPAERVRNDVRTDLRVGVDTTTRVDTVPMRITTTRQEQRIRQDQLQDQMFDVTETPPPRLLPILAFDDSPKKRVGGNIFYANYRELIAPVATFGEAFLAGAPSARKMKLPTVKRMFAETTGKYEGEIESPKMTELTTVRKGRSAPPWDIGVSPERRRKQRNPFDMEEMFL
jgi:hypothetical protein